MTKAENRRRLVYDAIVAEGKPCRERTIGLAVRGTVPMSDQNLQLAILGLLKAGMVRPVREWSERAHRWSIMWEPGSMWKEDGGGE